MASAGWTGLDPKYESSFTLSGFSPVFASAIWIGGAGVGLLLVLVIVVLLVRYHTTTTMKTIQHIILVSLESSFHSFRFC
jgi:uncharacterized membrane protein